SCDLMEQHNAEAECHQALRHDGQAVYAPQPVRLSHTRQRLIWLAQMIEDLGTNGQGKAQIEGMPAPARMGILGLADPHALLGITEHPSRYRRSGQAKCLWVLEQLTMPLFAVERQHPV